MLVDEVIVNLQAGNGGKGANCFKKVNQKLIGDGGDGGDGGNIFFQISFHLYDLSNFRKDNNFFAENGTSGSSNNKKGKKEET